MAQSWEVVVRTRPAVPRDEQRTYARRDQLCAGRLARLRPSSISRLIDLGGAVCKQAQARLMPCACDDGGIKRRSTDASKARELLARTGDTGTEHSKISPACRPGLKAELPA